MCSFSVPGLVDWALISLQLILSSSMTQTGLVGEEWSGNVFKSCCLASIGVCVCVYVRARVHFVPCSVYSFLLYYRTLRQIYRLKIGATGSARPNQ